MSNILIVDDEHKLSQWAGRQPLSTTHMLTSWRDFAARDFIAHVREHPVDVVVLHLEAPGALTLKEAVRLRDKQPNLGFVYVMDITGRLLPKQALRALTEPGVTWVSSNASPEEFELRLVGLVGSIRRSRERIQPTAATSVPVGKRNKSSWEQVMPALHNLDSGRLDAARIAEWFGIPLKAFARILDRVYATVHKTPDAVALQAKLSVFLRIASALSRLAGSHQGARIWLNAPNPELENSQTPLSAIEMGQQDVIAELLEDALAGHPG